MKNFDIRQVINENVALLDEFELKCSGVDQWQSLAKPVADCILRLRDAWLTRHDIYNVQIHGQFSDNNEHTCWCNNCKNQFKLSSLHHWSITITRSMRCPFCLYPYQ